MVIDGEYTLLLTRFQDLKANKAFKLQNQQQPKSFLFAFTLHQLTQIPSHLRLLLHFYNQHSYRFPLLTKSLNSMSKFNSKSTCSLKHHLTPCPLLHTQVTLLNLNKINSTESAPLKDSPSHPLYCKIVGAYACPFS